LRFADLLCDIADVDDTVGVELRPVADRHQDVWTRTRLNRRSDARLDAVTIDGLDLELYAEGLLTLGAEFSFQKLIGDRHEIDKFQPMDRRALGKGRCPPGGEDSSDSPSAGGDRATTGKLQ
jgi:hypothetical protein